MKAPLTDSTVYANANSAFAHLFDTIIRDGATRNGTKTLFNCGFYIMDPTNCAITVPWRKWKPDYAKREWEWYLSRDRSVAEIKKYAKIWDNMHNGDNIVNSNYGWQWNRNNQLEKCINQLRVNPNTRQAYVSIFDGKEKDEYEFDTPCTMYIGFVIVDNKLCMNVNMRSNDLIYGFCNDQYCFSQLQQSVAIALGLEVGWYYHFASDMHIYEKHWFMNNKITK